MIRSLFFSAKVVMVYSTASQPEDDEALRQNYEIRKRLSVGNVWRGPNIISHVGVSSLEPVRAL